MLIAAWEIVTSLSRFAPMGQILPKLLTVREFVDRYGDCDRYELIDGELIEMEPTGPHEEVAAFLGRKLNVAIEQQDEPFLIPYRCSIDILGTATAFRPDLIVLDQRHLPYEPLWRQEPVITLGTSIKLVVEIVSTNWQNDYARKAEDYALFGVSEFWIVDYLRLGGRDYIGTPKQPTLTLCTLQGNRYQRQLFRNDDRITSPLFPTLKLTANQVFAAGKSEGWT